MSTGVIRNSQVILTLGMQILSADDLLQLLIADYPDQGWTSEILNTILTQGARQGRYVRAACTPVVLWNIRTDMARVNSMNGQFAFLNPSILPPSSECGTSAEFSANTEPFTSATVCL